MCGIWALFGVDALDVSYAHKQFMRIMHRGPDAWRFERVAGLPCSVIGFHHLAIVSPQTGMQPLRLTSAPHVWLLHMGEIYNAAALMKEYGLPWERGTDGESIIQLYIKYGFEKTVELLDGVFAITLIDTKERKVYVARDLFGVRPLFYIMDEERGVLGTCSEAKGLVDLHVVNGNKVQWFPPASYQTFSIDSDDKVKVVHEPKQFIEIGGIDYTRIPRISLVPDDVKANIRVLLKDAVKKRLMGDRRIGCMLSGGLDSSLVAALMVECAKEAGLNYPIQTFSIGMEGSPDVEAARKVAAHLGTEHHEVSFTAEDGFNAVCKTISHIESYDITTIRASVGMYLVSRYIAEKTDTPVIFSGEGSDELTQGYIYFHKAPSPAEADEESRRLLKDIYMYDALRSDRTTAAHGLEVRVPFLDRYFTSYFLSLPPEIRQPQKGVEKHLLREAFSGTGLLPDEILWRPKEAFSDGVSSAKKGKSWFELLQSFAHEKISDEQLAKAGKLYPKNPPRTKEAFFYRQQFDEEYRGHEHFIPYYWMPKWTGATDPSARTLSHYKSAE